MKAHSILWYFVMDALANARAWVTITMRDNVTTCVDSIRAFLWGMYHDERQMIELIESDARANLRAAKKA